MFSSSVDSALKCLVEVDGLLCIVTLSANHTAVPCSVDNSIQLQVMYDFYVMQCRQFYTTPGNVWFLRHVDNSIQLQVMYGFYVM